ncbi:hypothetical protein BJ875DRAFT_109260 [Amylocarpus encephaloides]|uniref:Uncharacterized protein n=1 Tax=Amylocarpus encephaloides TaxID=45428 RepID=A0A9P7YRM4_9HELO|nr:hypothetical protein BJ875DRAFT_109260 [Amylocarpus encephaloides]
MGLSKSRTITLVVAIATLTSNILWSILFSQFPDDLYHFATNFGWYLHFANILSVFGFVGALRQHALSIAIFSNYLIIDTILCAIPRFIILTCLHQLSGSFCAPSSSSLETTSSYTYGQQRIAPHSAGQLSDLSSPSFEPSALESITTSWSEEGCNRILRLAQLTLAAGCVAATLLQFVGALYVREYARSLWATEVMEEGIYRATLVSERVVLEEEGVEKR